MAGDEAITVVTGLPRSGTSLMMRMLEAGGMPVLTDAASPPGEDNPGGFYEYEPVKRTRGDASWVEAARGRAVKVVVPLVCDLPRDRPYRVVFMRRDLDEVIASQRAMLVRQGRCGADLDDEALRGAFRRQLERAEAWLAKPPPGPALPVSYNELVLRPVAGAEAVSEFLGGRLDAPAMARVVDPALYRVRGAEIR